MFLGLAINLLPRKSLISGDKSVGVAGFEPNTYLDDNKKL